MAHRLYHTPDIRIDGELWEIKRIQTANPTYNTTNDHLKRTSKKRGARYVCFDNADGNMPDGSLVENILRSRSFRRGRVYIIDSDGNYRFIR